MGLDGIRINMFLSNSNLIKVYYGGLKSVGSKE